MRMCVCVVTDAGLITVSRRMDYETFPEPKRITALLIVYVPAMPDRTVNASLWIVILDVNDNSPVFSESSVSLLISSFLPHCVSLLIYIFLYSQQRRRRKIQGKKKRKKNTHITNRTNIKHQNITNSQSIYNQTVFFILCLLRLTG